MVGSVIAGVGSVAMIRNEEGLPASVIDPDRLGNGKISPDKPISKSSALDVSLTAVSNWDPLKRPENLLSTIGRLVPNLSAQEVIGPRPSYTGSKQMNILPGSNSSA